VVNGEPNRVTWRLGMVHNLGNFENITIQHEISSDVKPGETISAASDRVWAAVEEEFTKKAQKAWGELGG